MAWKEKEAKSSAFETHAWKKSGTHSHSVPVGVRKKKNGNRKPMRFCSLHHHSTLGSYLDGFGLPESHVRRAGELQMSAIAMTEHGGVESHVQLEKACAKLGGVKPLFGCEVYMGKVGEEATQKKYHLTILAKNKKGYENLLQLVSKAYSEGFYYEPTVSWPMLVEHREGLVVLSGCQGSLLFCSAVGGKLVSVESASYRSALRVARAFKNTFGNDYFIEVQAFPQLEKTRDFNPIAERISRHLSIGLVGSLSEIGVTKFRSARRRRTSPSSRISVPPGSPALRRSKPSSTPNSSLLRVVCPSRNCLFLNSRYHGAMQAT
jgi:hypothetical protein